MRGCILFEGTFLSSSKEWFSYQKTLSPSPITPPHWDRVNFEVDSEEKTPQSYYTVPREEGKVRSHTLWLSERDDDKALDFLIEDKKDRIRQYEARIANIKRDIEILEKTC